MKNLSLSLKLELILLITLSISFITSFFTKVYFYSEYIMAILLIIMGYNNQKHIKRKYLTYVYYTFGALVIIFTTFKLLHG